ncbi:MAG: PAS domain S-box protein, partial [Deltaproteobacteria bacterium]|nr:PAS domain S-box protein [Deltaproteobacteria bacterium]
RDITERKKAEKELKEGKDFLESIIEGSRDGIAIADEKGYIISVNTALEKMCNFSKEELIGKHASTLTIEDKDLREKIRKKVGELFEKGFTFYEAKHNVGEGDFIDVECSLSMIKDEKGDYIAGVSIIRDITERKKIEKEIREVRDFLENIFKTSVDGIMVTDAQSYITMVNEAVEKMLGYSKGELVGKHTMELTPERMEDKERTKEFVSKLSVEGVIRGFEHTWVRKDRGLVDFEINVALLKDTEGNTTGSVGSIRDITDRKRAEKTLRKSEEKYHKLIEHANDAIISVNKDGVIMGFNKRAEEMFGYSREEMFGKPGHLLAPPYKRENQRKMLEKFKAGKLSDIDKNILEGKGLKKDGQEFPAEFSSYILEFDGEQIATTILRDVTERKQAE